MNVFDPARIRIIGFDADDTLWMNEPLYRETEREFCKLLEGYKLPEEVNRQLYEVEVGNLERYGYGTKAFILSLIETAIIVSEGRLTAAETGRILDLGKKQISMKNPLLPGVPDVLRTLSQYFRLIVATKGDLLDQERKLKESGISGYFHHVEIMSDKKEDNYQRLFAHLDIRPDEFLMIGNSLKSDILPVVRLGGSAIHIPYHVTWQHEEIIPDGIQDDLFMTIREISEVVPVLTAAKSVLHLAETKHSHVNYIPK
jgi:putative hydrolase of the HAD superfamily